MGDIDIDLSNGGFNVNSEDGNFSIDGAPPGTYQMLASHERMGEKRFEITVWKTVTKRGGKGTALFKRGSLAYELIPEPTLPEVES